MEKEIRELESFHLLHCLPLVIFFWEVNTLAIELITKSFYKNWTVEAKAREENGIFYDYPL